MELNISVECLVCNEPVRLSKVEIERFKHNLPIGAKICDKCKKAILHYRKELEEKESEKVAVWKN